MYLENFENMQPIMLMSIINMKLRDEFNGNLNDLVKSNAINRQLLEDKLASVGFTFSSQTGQFR